MGKRVSSSQNERTLRGVGCSKTNKDEQGGRWGGKNSGLLSERTF